MAGTRVATDRGAVPVEEIRRGDRVLTRDNGYRPVRWIGARHFDAKALAEFPELQPVTVRAGAIAAGVPARDLTVSPQHRILLTGDDAFETAGESEVLAAAADLTGRDGIDGDRRAEVIYYHLMFDAHEVISTEGCWTESFLPEAAALSGLHGAQYREIVMIFPELATDAGQLAYAPARTCIDRKPRLTVVRAA